MSIRARLLGLLLAVGLPLIGVAAAGVYAAYRSERQSTEALLHETSRALALGVDREVGKAAVALRILAQSKVLADGDYAAFHERAKRAVDNPNSWIALVTPDGQPVLTTAAPYGTALPKSPRVETYQRIARTRQAEVSGVFTGAYTGRTVIALEVPVLYGDQVRYILTMALSAELFQTLLAEFKIPASWNTSITDRDGRIVARSRDHERFVAKQTSKRFRNAIQTAPEGALQTTSLDGIPILTSYARSPQYGLYTAVNYPLAEFESAALRSLWWILALVAVAAGGLLIALHLTRSIAEPVISLRDAAQALGAGERVQPSRSGLSEVDEVQQELVRADQSRRDAEARVRESEERLRLAIKAADLGTWEYEPAGNQLIASAGCKAKFGREPDEPFTCADLMATTHPEDRDRLQQAVQTAVTDQSSLHLECRALWPDGNLHWVQLRGRAFARDGSVRLVGVSQDVTAQHTAEAQRDLLAHELNHRVKNILATVQSIAAMTFRSSSDPKASLETFNARLIGMSKTQDLLTASQWEGASVRDILEAELDHYQDIMRQRIALRGKPVTLGPQATLAFSLAVHELATNAVKYGSLSAPQGRLVVRWRTVMIEALPHLLIEWAESGGPPVVAPTRQGFGTRLIQRGLAQDLGGTIKLNFASAGLLCVITFPLHRVVSEDDRNQSKDDRTGVSGRIAS